MGFWLSHIFTYSILQNTVTCEMSEMSNTMQTAPVCKRNPARKEVKLRRRRISITTRCPAVFCLLILAPVNIELNTDLYIKLFDGKKISKRMENIRWCHHAESCIMMHHDASCIFVGTGFWIDIFRNDRKHWSSFEFIWTYWSFSKSNSNEAIEALGSLGHPENQIVGEIFESKRHVKKM